MKFKTFNEWLEATQNLKQEDFDGKDVEEKGTLFATYLKDVKEEFEAAEKALSDSQEKADDLEVKLSELKDEYTKAREKSIEFQVKTINQSVYALGKQIKAMKDAGAGAAKIKATLEEEIAEKRDSLKAILKGDNSEIVLKANTLRSSIATNTAAVDLPGVGQLGHRRLTALDVFPIINLSSTDDNGTVRYIDWDDVTTVRAAAMMAEGGTFPESTAKFVRKTLDLKKIGDILPVSEEFFDDEAMAAGELQMFLQNNVDIICDGQVISGDGTGNNLSGLDAVSPDFTPVASGISDASIYDLIVKVHEDITSTKGSKYRPDTAFMNISDINAMRLKKDANENYVLPPFVDREGNVVAGVRVIENNEVTANEAYIFDSNFGRIYAKEGYSLSRGHRSDEFGEDIISLKARKRMLFLVREADKSGFRHVTSISAALTTLATP